MKSILAVAVLIAILSLCNLTDKTKPTASSNSPDRHTTETQRAAENEPQQQNRSNPGNSANNREAVTVELMKLEYELTSASLNGDISTLASYVADDYSGTGADGKTQNKNQLLASTKPDKLTKSWKITDGQLVSLSDDSAVLTYIQNQTLRNGQTVRARVTDTFVKRNGRWLVKSEQQTIMR